MDTTTLQTKRDELLSKIAAATTQMNQGDQSITYQSIEQMERALRIIDREIAKAAGTVSRTGRLTMRSGY